MLKILQARLQQYMNRELPDVQAGFRKGRGTRDQIANICWIIKKQESSNNSIVNLLYWLCQSLWLCSVQSLSRARLFVTMNRSMPGLPVCHQFLESTQIHVHRVSDAIQPSHPLSSPSPPALSHSQHQGLFKWVSSSHQVAKVLEFQLQHQSFHWIFRTDFL